MTTDLLISILNMEKKMFEKHLTKIGSGQHMFGDNEGVELHETLKMIDAIERLKYYYENVRRPK